MESKSIVFRVSRIEGKKLNSPTSILHTPYPIRPSSARGFSLVEGIVASAVTLVVILGIITVFSATIRAASTNVSRIQASFLQEEGIEVARILRDNSWSINVAAQSAGVPFYIAYDGTTWKATTTPQYIDGRFLRTITFDNVYRDATSKDIVTSGGTIDTDTKKVTASVAWSDRGATSTYSLQTYLANLFNN